MNDHTNGASAPINPLGDAINRHAAMTLKMATLPNGMLQINPAQLLCDLELAQVRNEVLFEALVTRGLLDPTELAIMLRDKLNAESDEIASQLEQPQLEIVRGSIPRNG